MADIPIHQALFHRADGEAPRLLAQSPGCRDDWLTEAEVLVAGFGDRPLGVACPGALFAHPLGEDQVAVVHVADQYGTDAGHAVAGFHVLIIPRQAYERFLGDPFAVGRRLPPLWQERAGLPIAMLAAEPLPGRTIDDVRRVLQRIKAGALREDREPEDVVLHTEENSESPALLGGAQVLVDGGRLVFERPRGDAGLIPALWTLLPNSTRCRLWPASFAFGNALAFDALVVARAGGPDYEGYTSEEQAADYPPGRYELNLQVAAETGDQRQLDILLSRRSFADTWRLALSLLALVLFLSLAARVLEVLLPPQTRPPTHETQATVPRAATAAAIISLNDPLNTVSVWPVAAFELRPPVVRKAAIAAGIVSLNDPLNSVSILPTAAAAWKRVKEE
jgi:hypothetical protein